MQPRSRKLLILAGLLIVFSSFSGYSQQMCSVVRMKVSHVRGNVVTNDKDPYPFSLTKVELYKVNNGGLVGSTNTDKNGFFDIEYSGKGEAVLVVWATTEKGLTLFTYTINLSLTKARKKKANQTLYVRLGRNCFDSKVDLVAATLLPD